MKDLLLYYLYLCICLSFYVCIRAMIDLTYEMYKIDMNLFDRTYIQLLFTNRNKLSSKLGEIKNLSVIILFSSLTIMICVLLIKFNM